MDLRNVTDAELEALWDALDQTEMAIVPALAALAAKQPGLSAFAQHATAEIKRGVHDAARTAAHEETKRRFLLSRVRRARRRYLDLTGDSENEQEQQDEQGADAEDNKRARVE